MSIYEAPVSTAKNICFVGNWALLSHTKQIFWGVFRQKSLMFPHIPHTVADCLTSNAENMRIMRIYEDR